MAESDPSVIQVGSPHFIFRFHEQDRYYMDRIIARSETLYQKVTRDIGFTSAEPIGVIIAFTEKEFNQFQPKGDRLPQWAIGVAYPELNLMAIRSPRLVEGAQENPLEIFIRVGGVYAD